MCFQYLLRGEGGTLFVGFTKFEYNINFSDIVIMKYLKSILLLLLVSLFASCTSCGGDKNNEHPYHESTEFKKELTAEDTTRMLEISNMCMESLKAGHIDQALSQLYMYDDSTETVKPLTAQKRKELQEVFKLFPVLKYSMNYFSFNTKGVNDVKYTIEFFEKTDSSDTAPNTIGFMFNPVKVDGQWYLTVKDGKNFDEKYN